MNRLLKSILAMGLFAAIGFTARAQTNTTIFGLSGSTNWVAVPYGIYRVDTKQWGFGGAVFYKVSDNFYAGVRADSLNSKWTTAGVQLQLQATVHWAFLNITPFLEASTGMGSSSLYASAGPGAAITFASWQPTISGHKIDVTLGLAGDYEHVVNGSESFQQVCGGPLIKVSF